jgi:hypothetical protein
LYPNCQWLSSVDFANTPSGRVIERAINPIIIINRVIPLMAKIVFSFVIGLSFSSFGNTVPRNYPFRRNNA